MVGLSPRFECSGQNLLVYLQFLYVVDNSGWYIALICLSRTIMVGIFPCHEQKWVVCLPVLSAVDNIGWYIIRFCLSWTIMVGKSTCFVCHGQYWFVYQKVLSV